MEKTLREKQIRDHTRRHEDMTMNASIKFQRLLDACLRDGHISRAEAAMLVQEHNRLQEDSRRKLRERLTVYGHQEYTTDLHVRNIPLPVPPRPDVVTAHEVAAQMRADGEPFFHIHLGKKKKFALIILPAIFAVLLELAGAI